ncbi:MAG TPA: hypothetical protein VD930_11035 [Gemmatimonadales bacterium]|nr:hypothetical protein [Gemmatimonadales bacterium]
MNKPISPRTHGLLDYATAGATAVLSRVLGFSPPAARTAQTWAAGYGALSALTDYPLAVKRAVPFRAHGAMDAVMAPIIPALPWLLGFARDRRARNFFLGLAAVTVIVTALTDWKSPATGRA